MMKIISGPIRRIVNMTTILPMITVEYIIFANFPLSPKLHLVHTLCIHFIHIFYTHILYIYFIHIFYTYIL